MIDVVEGTWTLKNSCKEQGLFSMIYSYFSEGLIHPLHLWSQDYSGTPGGLLLLVTATVHNVTEGCKGVIVFFR